MTKYNKAFAALGPAVVGMVSAFGFDMTPEQQAGLNQGLLFMGTILVFIVPNQGT